ncbi:hypothetical protein CTheo_9078 [Ceratobasidium theobromae]|uniref:DUF6532 domain-containing protein n=1 Tax=Ceratobasidium theobromae TaxID=1582974 RepID=A0A5N5Q7M8_9AGAM|nr:hypothetical protein CTheo_9078 [Ceratobasidium theobromae]
MQNQKASQGLITSFFTSKSAPRPSTTLLPAATILQAPRTGGPNVHRMPTSTELARQEALCFNSTGDRSNAMNTDSTESDDDDNFETGTSTGRPRIADLDESMRPVIVTACEIYRILIVTRAAFPDPIQRASYRQEAMDMAWKDHKLPGKPPLMSAIIRRLLDQRIAQVRGDLKVAARGMVVQGYSLINLTAAQKLAKVLTLVSERTFQVHYEHIDEIGHGSGKKFSHPCIAELLIQVFFKTGHTSDGYRHFYLFNPITPNLVAILLVSIMVALQEHMSGEGRINVNFRESEFRPLFIKVKQTIEHFRDKRRSDYDEMRLDLLNSCR